MKILAKLLALIFILLVLLTFFAPSLISTQFGKNSFFKIIKSMSGYEVHAENLSLSWTQGQSAQKIVVRDQSHNVILSIDGMSTDATLWKILFYHDVGRLEVQAPSVVIEPPLKLTSKLTAIHAGFSLGFTFTPKMDVLGEIAIKDGSAQFVTPGLEPIYMQDVEAEASIMPQQIKLVSSGTTKESSGAGTFQMNVLAYPGTDQIDGSLKLTNFPLRAADQIVSILQPSMNGMIRDTIGESINVDLKVKNLKEQLELFLQANSPLFSADLETIIQGDTLILSSPATMQIAMPPVTFEKLTSIPVSNAVSAQIKVDQLSIPLEQRDQFTLQGTIKSDGFQSTTWNLDPFTLFVGSSETVKNEWDVKIDSPQVQFQGSVTLPEIAFSGEALLPYNTKLSIKADSLQAITLLVQGDLWRGRFKAAFDPVKKSATLLEKGYITYNLQQLPDPLPPLLKEPLPVQVVIDPTKLSLDPMSGIVNGSAKLPPFLMGTSEAGETTLQFTTDIKTKNAQFSFTSSIDNGPLSAEGSFVYPSNIKLQGACTNLPITSLQPFITNGLALEPLLGNSLSTSFSIEKSDQANYLQLNSSSPLLKLSAVFQGDGEHFQLKKPANFIWTLTPQGYAALAQWMKGSATYALAQPATLKGSLSSFSADLHQISSLIYEAQLSSDAVSFSTGSQTSTITNINISLDHAKSDAPHTFQMSALSAPSGKLLCQGSITPPGTADLKLLLEQFPAASFDFFASPFSGKAISFATLCGPVINLNLNTTMTNWNGPISLDLQSMNLRSSLQGQFTDGNLTLTNPLHLQLSVTPALTNTLSKGTASIRSEAGPVTLVIEPSGFSYPIQNNDLTQLQVSSARLELGKLLCRNEGNIQSTLSLLKSGLSRSGEDIELWFAPCDFSITNGIINYERTEILFASEYQMCTWGTIDLSQDSIDAILGLTGHSLQRAFGVPSLPKNYVLQIPIYGSLSDIKLDTGKATSKVAALMLWQQKGNIAENVVPGPWGKLLGQGLNKIGPLPGGDDKAPPPKKPFPWDKETSSSHDLNRDPFRKHFKHDEPPLKQALRLIK